MVDGFKGHGPVWKAFALWYTESRAHSRGVSWTSCLLQRELECLSALASKEHKHILEKAVKKSLV